MPVYFFIFRPREDAYKKSFFLEVGPLRLTPPRPLSKKTLYSINLAFLAQKCENEKKIQNPFHFQAIIILKK